MGRVTTQTRSKFNKEKCRTCMFHAGCRTELHGHYNRVVCNYGEVTHTSCLQRQPDGSVKDIRGDDYDNCLCFKEGHMTRQERRELFGRGGKY